jgi:two-component system, cell cycle sensor histidine kinase and response regulator CckA
MAADFDERAVFVAGPVVVFKWKNEPGWPVDYASPNAVEVFGYTAEEFLTGEAIYATLILEEDGARVANEVKAASEGREGSFVHEPYRIRHRSGSVRWLYDFTRILRDPASGAALFYLGYVIDITERIAAEEETRELERRLLHAQKLESLGILAGGVAHDFNNVLTGILGHAGIVRRNLEAAPYRAHEGLEQIEHLARQASHLTRQLLAYAGKARFVVEALDLGEIVRDVVGMLEVILPKNAVVHLDVAANLPSVIADRGELQQVAMNLLTNAAEALGETAGSVTIRTAPYRLTREESEREFARDGLREGDYVALEVADTGCGMDAEVLAKLFDPFFTTKGSGRGLGMSAVLGIMRSHAGAIRVSSQPLAGTTFRLLFPSSPRVPPERSERRAPVAFRGSGTVLVADDEGSVRWILKEVLSQMGFTVLVAANGAEAVKLHAAHAAAIVLALIDMTMPVMGGAAALQALREHAPALPIVMMSGYSEHFALEHVDARYTAFLQKPYSVHEVEDVVRRLLGPA